MCLFQIDFIGEKTMRKSIPLIVALVTLGCFSVATWAKPATSTATYKMPAPNAVKVCAQQNATTNVRNAQSPAMITKKATTAERPSSTSAPGGIGSKKPASVTLNYTG
jgi:hypothetical protein